MKSTWDYLNSNENAIVFDVDGTLFSYNYGTFTAHHDLDKAEFENDFKNVNMYKDAKGIPVIREFIKKKDIDNIFVLSREPHGHQMDKTQALIEYYGINPKNCFYVDNDEDKVKVLFKIHKKTKKDLVFIDDSEPVLRFVEENTNFVTAHVTIFFEEGAKI